MKLSEYLTRLICPPSCICCHKILDFYDNSAFCDSCFEALEIKVADLSAEIEDGRNYVNKLYFYYYYKNWYVGRLITHTKHISSAPFKSFIGKRATISLKRHNLLHQIDTITFPPRRRQQANLHGFDHAEELAKAISDESGIPCRALLTRQGHAKVQKKLTGEERRKNVLGKYKCSEKLGGKRVLLVDDVVTTGATVTECAKALKEQGAKAVYVWALAK